jgi:pimeloyl-ACP methyl ester carboxylesterase
MRPLRSSHIAEASNICDIACVLPRSPHLRFFLLIAFLSMLASCEMFDRLREDLETLEKERTQYFGTVENQASSGESVVVVYMGNEDGSEILDYRVLPTPGEFEIWLFQRNGWFFAFADANRDLIFQPSESYGWSNHGNPIHPGYFSGRQISIQIAAADSGQPPPPANLIGRSPDGVAVLQGVGIGELADIEEERFSEESANKGLWQPYAAVLDKVAGIFFTEPYDEGRVPILLVHGIGGYPAQFKPLIQAIDRNRYQVWFANYPSGLRLGTTGNSLFQMMEILHSRFHFENAHLVAHSMGGLVSRSYLQECTEKQACGYLKTFTSIASPFGGVESASMGVEYAPAVIPSWLDLQPTSEFLSGLFSRPLPPSVEYYLFFAYHMDLSIEDMLSIESSDGVIALSSQLRREAQDEAARVIGFDQTHTGILSDPQMLDKVLAIIESKDGFR